MADNIGNKLRAARREKSITLKQLGEKTRLSVGFLSEVERGLAQPSVSSLKKIAQALGISLFNFREQEGTANNHTRFNYSTDNHYNRRYIKEARVVRAGHRKKLLYPRSDVVYELLTPDLNRLMEIQLTRHEPDTDSGPEKIVDPPGEKFVFVLGGNIEFTVGEDIFELEEGDSLYYPGDFPVSYRVTKGKPCRCIFIVTPPSF